MRGGRADKAALLIKRCTHACAARVPPVLRPVSLPSTRPQTPLPLSAAGQRNAALHIGQLLLPRRDASSQQGLSLTACAPCPLDHPVPLLPAVCYLFSLHHDIGVRLFSFLSNPLLMRTWRVHSFWELVICRPMGVDFFVNPGQGPCVVRSDVASCLQLLGSC